MTKLYLHSDNETLQNILQSVDHRQFTVITPNPL